MFDASSPEEPIEPRHVELPLVPSIQEREIFPEGNRIYCERRGLVHDCSSAFEDDDSLEVINKIGTFERIVITNSSAIVGDNFLVMEKRHESELECSISESKGFKVLKC